MRPLLKRISLKKKIATIQLIKRLRLDFKKTFCKVSKPGKSTNYCKDRGLEGTILIETKCKEDTIIIGAEADKKREEIAVMKMLAVAFINNKDL